MASRLETALSYAARGWPVLALYGVGPDGACGCGGTGRCSAGKHPRWRHGLKEATTEAQRIRAWGKRWEQSNIGIRTGAASGLLVLDIDPRHGGDRALRVLEEAHGPLGRTLECLTGGGGRHLYFAYPGGHVPNSSGRLGAGLDVRAEGGYVVAPPSTHPQGLYRWKVAPEDQTLPAQAPAWLLSGLRTPAATGAPAMDIDQGTRNQRLFSLAGALRRQGLSAEALAAALAAVNERCCRPPLSPGELETIARSVTRYPVEAGSAAEMAVLTKLSAVKPSEIRWLWPGRIPLGKLTLLAGDPGLGKSLVTLDIAARVSTGKDWPDSATHEKPAGVVLLAAEDDLADTVRPRLDKAAGDAERVSVLTAVRTAAATRPFNLAADLDHLQGALTANPETRLVVIDPITAYLGDAEAQSNAEIRALLAPLAALAADLQVAIVAVTHLRKSGGKAIYRAMGSLAFTAAARAVWGVAKDPNQDTRQLLVPVKMNIGPQPTGLAYSIAPGPVIAWDATAVDFNAERLLGEAGPLDSALDEAVEFLTSALSSGPCQACDTESAALAAGISKASLKRGRRRLRVRTRKDATGKWMLSLPQAPSTQPQQQHNHPTLPVPQ
jgi:hypothetical protein